MAETKEKLRIDKYLWAIRLYKTRSLTTDACNRGKVKMMENPVKPSKTVNVGEEYEIKTEARKWVIKVTGLLFERVQYTEAVKYYNDLTPEDEKQELEFQPSSFHTGKRLSKVGRPTKKQRRELGDWLEE